MIRVAPTLPTAALVAVTAPVAHRNFLDLGRYLFWLSPTAITNFLWTTVQFVLPAATSLAVAAAGLATTWREPAWRFLRLWLLARRFVIEQVRDLRGLMAAREQAG